MFSKCELETGLYLLLILSLGSQAETLGLIINSNLVDFNFKNTLFYIWPVRKDKEGVRVRLGITV